MSIQLSDLVKSLNGLESGLENSGDSLECDINLEDGDGGGQEIVMSLSPGAAVHIARQLVQLVERDFHGAHFHIDNANIAVDTDHQLCFALRKPNGEL